MPFDFDYDLIVAGDGIAGFTVAHSAAFHSNQNARILLIARNSLKELGKKTTDGWPCGDAVNAERLDHLSKNLHLNYGWPEIEHEVDGVGVVSPDYQTHHNFEGRGYILNRKIFPQKMYELARNLGVEFLFESSVEDLIIMEGSVVGVEGRQNNKTTFRKYAKVVVDATGMASPLRRKLHDKFVEKEIDQENDVVAIKRYILYFDPKNIEKNKFDPKRALIHLDQEGAPGGYKWNFAKGENKVNIGVGISNKLRKIRNQEFGRNDTLLSFNEDYTQDIIGVSLKEAQKNMFTGKLPRLADGEGDIGNEKNSWQASVRRHNDLLVSNGVLLAGDSAFGPRAVDAGGMGNAFIQGEIAGEEIATAIEKNDFSRESLWRYNYEYNQTKAGRNAAVWEVFRRFLQKQPNRELNYGMKKIVRPEDISKFVQSDYPEFEEADERGLGNKLKILIKHGRHLGLLRDLAFFEEKAIKLQQHYKNTPESFKEYPEWRKELNMQMNEAFERFPL